MASFSSYLSVTNNNNNNNPNGNNISETLGRLSGAGDK
jgi:hypothetical protein